MKQFEGQIVEVLVEGESKRNDEVLSGYTRKSKLVNFKAPSIRYWKTCTCENNRCKNMVARRRIYRRRRKGRGNVIMEKKYTKDDIIAKAKEIALMIANTEQVDFFKRAEAQINENQKIRENIASLKSLQKQAVNFQQYGKEKALEIIEGKIDKIQE